MFCIFTFYNKATSYFFSFIIIDVGYFMKHYNHILVMRLHSKFFFKNILQKQRRIFYRNFYFIIASHTKIVKLFTIVFI